MKRRRVYSFGYWIPTNELPTQHRARLGGARTECSFADISGCAEGRESPRVAEPTGVCSEASPLRSQVPNRLGFSLLGPERLSPRNGSIPASSEDRADIGGGAQLVGRRPHGKVGF